MQYNPVLTTLLAYFLGVFIGLLVARFLAINWSSKLSDFFTKRVPR